MIMYFGRLTASNLHFLVVGDSQQEDLLWMHTAQVPVDSIRYYGAELSSTRKLRSRTTTFKTTRIDRCLRLDHVCPTCSILQDSPIPDQI